MKAATTTDTLRQGPTFERAGMRLVALFELAKGILVLLLGVGAVYFLGQNIDSVVIDVTRRLALDPASRIAHLAVEWAARAQGVNPFLVLGLCITYAMVRAAIGYGLWTDRSWGEVLGAWAGGVYLPFELYEAFRRPSWPHWLLVAANLLIVAFLLHHHRRRKLKESAMRSRGGSSGANASAIQPPTKPSRHQDRLPIEP